MVEFKVRKGNILVGIYLNGNKGNIVLSSGIPQFLDKYHPFVGQMKRIGYNLFIPRFMGTYESDGTFNTRNSAESIESAVKLVRSGKGTELFGNTELKWDNNNISIIGFSYGALPALLQREIIDRTLLICPFVDLKYHLNGGNGEDVRKTFEFIERAYPHIYRLNASEVIDDLSKISLPTKKDNLIVIRDLSDSLIPFDEIELLKKKYGARIIDKGGGHNILVEDNLLEQLLAGR